MHSDYYLTSMSRTSSFSRKTRKNFQRIPRSVTFSGKKVSSSSKTVFEKMVTLCNWISLAHPIISNGLRDGKRLHSLILSPSLAHYALALALILPLGEWQQAVSPPPIAGRSMGSETEGRKERVFQTRPSGPPTTNHVESSEVRRARMDCVLLSRSSNATPRSASYSRPKTARSQSARPPPRSNSANRLREQAEADEKEKRAMAEAAFQAWIKRKAEMPRQPRASPSREQIEQYTKDDRRQRVLNQWHLKGIQRTKPETRSPSSPKENGASE